MDKPRDLFFNLAPKSPPACLNRSPDAIMRNFTSGLRRARTAVRSACEQHVRPACLLAVTSQKCFMRSRENGRNSFPSPPPTWLISLFWLNCSPKDFPWCSAMLGGQGRISSLCPPPPCTSLGTTTSVVSPNGLIYHYSAPVAKTKCSGSPPPPRHLGIY